MRIVSVNLNQRLGNASVRARVEAWLQVVDPDLFLSQEPFKPQSADERPQLAGYKLMATSPLISSWVADKYAAAAVLHRSERWHEISAGALAVHNVYLSPYSSKERREMLVQIAAEVGRAGRHADIVVGDFNLAPRPADGRVGDGVSNVTRLGERKAFATLLKSGSLYDSTCPEAENPTEMTFERFRNNSWSRFRCDLALLSHSLRRSTAVTCDHSVRNGGHAFTDHSAIIVDCQIAHGPGINASASTGSGA